MLDRAGGDTAGPSSFKSAAATLQLPLIGRGHARKPLRHFLQLRIRAPVAAHIALRTGIIGEVEAVGVVELNARRLAVLPVIPADEIDRVGEVGAPRAPVSGCRLVV